MDLIQHLAIGFGTAIAVIRVGQGGHWLSDAYFAAALERIRSLPGVEAAGATNYLPLRGTLVTATSYEIEGVAPEELGENPFAVEAVATPGYFEAMGLPLLEGRPFDSRDRSDAPPVVIIDETMARAYWPDRSPLGARITLYGESEPREVVGVVGTAYIQWVLWDPWKTTYVPHSQSGREPRSFAIRSGLPPATLATWLRRELGAIDPTLPIYDVRTMQGWVDDQLAPTRFNALLLTGFGVVALVLATLGTYGVLSYSIAQRSREIAVRMALGARRQDVVRMVLVRGAALAGLGVTVGIAAALGLGRFVSSLLYEVTPFDPPMLLAASAASLIAALCAAYLPARRAARAEPMSILRE